MLLLRGGDRRLRLADLALVGEQAAAVGAARTARHRTGGGDHVAVQRHDAEGVRVFFGDLVRVGDGVGDKRVADQVIDDVVVILVVAHQLGRKSDGARLFEGAAGVLRFIVRFEGSDGQEGDRTALCAL